MYLKRLESVGFKSFAERINVQFVKGMTAVVGPNGSGKSNITDAIRWVLGEQSVKSLRGSKMEDIIFQGSDSRKALNVAEVKIVFDNSNQTLPIDYAEVSITRRVYRSGASEFYINNQSCRLKDIIDLFMDSGLGREAFSIIGQGKVEEILSSKAEERRMIFEEAAGVLKYKQRKKKAEYKLAETEENLSRVDDIVYEINQQIGPLSVQAEVAKNFINLSEQLKQEEISLLVTEIEQLHNQWKLILAELDNQHIEEVGLKTSIQKKEADLEKRKQLLQEVDQLIEQLQVKLLTSTQQLEQFQGKRHVLNERLKHFSQNKEKTAELKKDVMKRKEDLIEKAQKEKLLLNQLKTKRRETKRSIKLLVDKLAIDKEDIANQIENQKSEYIEALNRQAAKRNEKQSIERQTQQLTGKKISQLEKNEKLIKQREELNRAEKELSSELSLHKINYEKIETENTQLKEELAKRREKNEVFQANLSKGYQKIAKLKSRRDLLTEMKEGFQGFFHGVKNVLKARVDNVLPDVHGAVIELISVPEDYVNAIETVLGGQAQHIVVGEEREAREAIAWLKRTNNGRATFLPLNSIQPRFITADLVNKIKNHPGYVGIAANLVSGDELYQKVINHLMGHIVISRTLKDANEIANLLNNRYRIVTLEGDVVNPGGSMSGGAKSKSNQSLFTRDNDLKETSKTLADYEVKAKRLESELLGEKHEIQELEDLLLGNEQLLREKRALSQEIQSLHDKKTIELLALNERLSEFDYDRQMEQQDKDRLDKRSNELSSQLIEIEQQLKVIKELIDDLKIQEDDDNQNREHIAQDLQQHQIYAAEQTERIKNQQEKLMTTKEQLSEVRVQYEALISDLTELNDIDELKRSESSLEEQIRIKTEETEAFTLKIKSKRTERLKATLLSDDLERELKAEVNSHHAYLKIIQQNEVQANRLDVSLESKLSHLETEYTITYEKAKQTYDKVVNVDESKRYVEQLNFKIKRLGSVNLGSIDEYERISERHQFLMNQKNDLNEAKQTLYSIISEMDDVMKERFMHTFDQIRTEFSLVFKELFSGGQAELNLTDPVNVLETGIDIIAQPPGKKLQHLGLLSGGERALTAIALLFAILRVRPVPFCVLDEVEAALDEANVARFAKYLKQHSDETQFIVITHRKGTMEEADVLYGVTMQEAGVSRLVSVQLEESIDLVSS